MRSRFKVAGLKPLAERYGPVSTGRGAPPGEEFREAPRFDSDLKQLGSLHRLGSFEIDNLDFVRLQGPGMATFQHQISIQLGVSEVQEPVNTQRIAEAPGKKFAVPDVPNATVVTETDHESRSSASGRGSRARRIEPFARSRDMRSKRANGSRSAVEWNSGLLAYLQKNGFCLRNSRRRRWKVVPLSGRWAPGRRRFSIPWPMSPSRDPASAEIEHMPVAYSWQGPQRAAFMIRVTNPRSRCRGEITRSSATSTEHTSRGRPNSHWAP